MKSKPILLIAMIIGIVAFLAIRLTCDRRKPEPPKSKSPQIETPPARLVAGSYEMTGDDHMQVSLVVEAVADDEANFTFTGVSSDNRTVDMAGTASVYHSLTWYDEEQDCSLYIDFLRDRATVHNECEDCCESGVVLDGEYRLSKGAAGGESLSGDYYLVAPVGDGNMESVLRVSGKSGGAYSFQIDAQNLEDETAGSISGTADAYRSMIWRDEEQGCEMAIMFGKDSAAVSNTCEYCCQWRAYIDGDYLKQGE